MQLFFLRCGEHARIDGNHVLLRYGGGELTLYAHLKKGSIAVKPGQLDDTVYV